MLNIRLIKREHLERPIVWVDYESRMHDEEPALGSLVVGGGPKDSRVMLETFVFDARLAGAARQKELKLLPFVEHARELVERVRALDGWIAGYSEVELNELKKALPGEAEWLEGVYINANASNWFSRCRPKIQAELEAGCDGEDTFDRVGLKDYLQHKELRYGYPKRLVGFSPASALQKVREQLAKHHGNYAAITSRTKAMWVRLLKYNCTDVHGMRFLFHYMLRADGKV